MHGTMNLKFCVLFTSDINPLLVTRRFVVLVALLFSPVFFLTQLIDCSKELY
jgi:hypothetical protein